MAGTSKNKSFQSNSKHLIYNVIKTCDEEARIGRLTFPVNQAYVYPAPLTTNGQCYEVLAKAMTSLRGQPTPGGYPFETVHCFVLNPKSITMGQLYGEFDVASHEWTDGILSFLVRSGSVFQDSDKRWYCFDGPVDAVWIENMNSVLDDNKKLCLSNGEIIKLNDNQTLMFEVMDLAVASPATVSRCGMIYMEPGNIGLKPFVECWIVHKLPKAVRSYEQRLRHLFGFYLEPAINFMRQNVREIVGSVNGNLVFSMLKLLGSIIKKIPPYDNVIEARKDQWSTLLDSLFFFSLVWSVGATCDNDGRRRFSDWLRVTMELEKHLLYFPRDGLVFDYRVEDNGLMTNFPEELDADGNKLEVKWRNWMDGIPDYEFVPGMKYSEIIIPTMDTVRNACLIEYLLTNGNAVLAVGPTGTGKSVCIIDKLTQNFPLNFVCDFLSFSARTNANQTQDMIDAKLDKRRKGVFGPPPGKKHVFFIDDMNMPALETYGAQPPIELLRQFMDFSGWYDRKVIGDFRLLVDVYFICAVGPPGGGRNEVTARFLRHFNFLSFVELEDASKLRIFNSILSNWLCENYRNIQYVDQLVMSSITVYNTILEQLLPTPTKSHYLFNLRDLSKVFQGMLMFESHSIVEIVDLLRLWFHESCRIYQDRLVNDEDRTWFEEFLQLRMLEDFEVDPATVGVRRSLIYSDIMSAGQDTRVYCEIKAISKLKKMLQDQMEEYNDSTTAGLSLVLFLDAIQHVCRIGRVLKQPGGNCLLLGVGGSGRQSLTRLASFVGEMECFQIELVKTYGITEWREDLKKVMLKSGLTGRDVVFLFSDTQIKYDTFLEDLNNLLNSGDIPGIYNNEELERIYATMNPIVVEKGLMPTKSNFFSMHCKRVRSNLHCVIAMSPIGEVFRARLRMFPAFVNCCTINWFTEWPVEALEQVANEYISECPDFDFGAEIAESVMHMMVAMHMSVAKFSVQFKQELNRHNYVTPKSYLELLSIFGKLLHIKKNELGTAKKRMKTGLDKLLSTAKEVAQLQIDMEILKPQLVEAAIVTEETMIKIAEDTKVAEVTKFHVMKEEAEAKRKADITQAIADEAQKDLEEALPALDMALLSLKSLNKSDVVEMRAMQHPPEGVRLVMEAVCIMKGVKPKMIPGEKPGQKIADYWEPGKTLLQDPGKFLDMLFKYDKDNIPEDVIKKITSYIDEPTFTPEAIAKVSKACTSICQWVRAMHKYNYVLRVVGPKKEAMAVAQAELAEMTRLLDEAKARLHEVERGLRNLQDKLDECVRRKEELEATSKLTEERVIRADRLLEGLSDERVRWQESISKLELLINTCVGDVVVSSSFVNYLGPFTGEYRAAMMTLWVEFLKEFQVPMTSDPSLIGTFGDPVAIRNWQIAGLPKDNLSVENGMICQFTKRWPLFIDPQGQGNKWIKNLEKEAGVRVFKMSDKDILRQLENCIKFGKPGLMENVGEELDPSLDSVLNKQVFSQGGALVIKLGDTTIPYHKDFRLYITTQLPNPHYTPEVSIKVTVINFTLAPIGLEDQLLACVVAEDRPDLEEAKNQLIISNAQMTAELKAIEQKILYRLTASEGSPVDDIDLIETLEASKVTSAEIKVKVAAAEITEKEIDSTRMQYVPVSVRAQILFFCMSDLAKVDPMYQYSLEWFLGIFINSIRDSDRSHDVDQRLENINEAFTYNLYVNVCRSLFEKHKLMFAFLLTVRIEMNQKRIDMADWRYLLAGGTPINLPLENPDPKWISDRSWKEIMSVSNLPNFHGFAETFYRHLDDFRKLFDSNSPEIEEFPNKWKDLSYFQRLIVLRAIRPDKVTNGMQIVVAKTLGQRFIEPQTVDLGMVFKESSSVVPLIFILSLGTDPGGQLTKFAEEMNFAKKLSAISLGQGQGPLAEALMKIAMDSGHWVFFQNCHLAPSFMPNLNRMVEQIDADVVHPDFRLWLTSMPSPSFPVMILQNGCKMTVEPPRGIKANLLRVYLGITDEYMNSCLNRVDEFKYLLFSLCFFHSVIYERRKFGPLGFNNMYEFNDGDLRICIEQLFMFLQEYEEIAYKVLRYTAAQINYGGRVTDDMDRRAITTILEDFYHPKVLDSEFTWEPTATYRQVPPNNAEAYLEYIRGLPINDAPEIFGLHDNANITFAQNELYSTLNVLLSMQPRAAGSAAGQSPEQIVEEIALLILQKIIPPVNVAPVVAKYPIVYEESMNTVLVQELQRYNKVLRIIQNTLKDLLKALVGLKVMTDLLEEIFDSIYINAVPKAWESKAYPSLKPLTSWVNDLEARMDFFMTWVQIGVPNSFWISGFYFPQAFLTGVLQNYARKMALPIDTLSFGFKVMSERRENLAKPDDGCYIYGIFLEGARWDPDAYSLRDSRPKELYTEMAVMYLLPEPGRKNPTTGIYISPLYKTLARKGVLSTTGHSTNLVMTIEIPSDIVQSFWIKRGVAAVCALDY